MRNSIGIVLLLFLLLGGGNTLIKTSPKSNGQGLPISRHINKETTKSTKPATAIKSAAAIKPISATKPVIAPKPASVPKPAIVPKPASVPKPAIVPKPASVPKPIIAPKPAILPILPKPVSIPKFASVPKSVIASKPPIVPISPIPTFIAKKVLEKTPSTLAEIIYKATSIRQLTTEQEVKEELTSQSTPVSSTSPPPTTTKIEESTPDDGSTMSSKSTIDEQQTTTVMSSESSTNMETNSSLFGVFTTSANENLNKQPNFLANLSTTELLIPTNLTISNSTAIRPPFIKHPTLLICTIIAFVFFLIILIVCIHKIDVSKKKETATIDSKSVYKEMLNDPHLVASSSMNPTQYKSRNMVN